MKAIITIVNLMQILSVSSTIMSKFKSTVQQYFWLNSPSYVFIVSQLLQGMSRKQFAFNIYFKFSIKACLVFTLNAQKDITGWVIFSFHFLMEQIMRTNCYMVIISHINLCIFDQNLSHPESIIAICYTSVDCQAQPKLQLQLG